MNDPRREILNQVAAGTISAEEGASRLEALEARAAGPAPASPGTTAPQAGSTVKLVKLLSRFGNTEVIGDPNVATAVAEGPHRARQEGDAMVIEQSLLTDETSFEFSRTPGRVVVSGLPDFGRKLTVRMNPALPLAATVQAGNLRVTGVQAEVTGDIQAGNCNITDFRGPIKLNVAAGNVVANGRLDSGASAIRCDMGSVKVVLDKSSSVRIKARTTMGKVEMLGDGERGGNELTLGSGAGTLDCDCTMSSVRIAVE